MKKYAIAAALVAALLPFQSCGNKKLSEVEEKNPKSQLDDSLQVALANADSLFAMLYDVTVGMEQITRLEKLVGTEVSGESATARESIAKQMEAIQRGLVERRKRIEELERQLANNKGVSAKFRQQIEILRSQIDTQAATVASLQKQLESANIHIASLESEITGLNAGVDSINAVQKKTEAELNSAISDLNAVYYVIGSKDELKEHNIIEGGGFLRKTKVLPSDFDKGYMTRADRRSLAVIPLDSKKAKVLTSQPTDSYRIDRASNGQLSLVITNPDAFWGTTNILVIKID
ncbi:MAG: hypothetical protein K2G15_04335 [Muribaculaceae bacterium]|nr:hypothetical protein [Muribaculaceae bacterium]